MIFLSYILRDKPIKDNLIGSLLHFYKNDEEGNVTFTIRLQLLQIPKQIYKTLTFTLKVFVRQTQNILMIHLSYIVH